MDAETTTAGIGLAKDYLKEGGAYAFTLFVMMLLSWAVAGAVFWWYAIRGVNRHEAKTKKAVGEAVTTNDKYWRTQQENLQKHHDSEMQDMQERLGALASGLPAVMDKVHETLRGFRQDLQRIYDRLEKSSKESSVARLDEVSALKDVAAAIQTFPVLVENIYLKLMKEKP